MRQVKEEMGWKCGESAYPRAGMMFLELEEGLRAGFEVATSIQSGIHSRT
jgi:hypothetical protein